MSSNSHYEPAVAGLLSPLNAFLSDPDVNELMINRPGQVFIERLGQISSVELPQLSLHYLQRLFQLIANENGQVLNEQSPVLSGNLHDGSRVQLVVAPVVKYPTLTIRRSVRCAVSLADYRDNHFYNAVRASRADLIDSQDEPTEILRQLYKKNAWADFIDAAIKFKKNIVVSGGTSSGKTTFLNACLAELNLDTRLVVLEDTREISVPHQNSVHLLSQKGEVCGAGAVTMQSLVQCSLRLRPDRIIVGEIRGKELLDFLAAASTGHEGSMTSIHANNPKVALMRMTQLYKLNNVPMMSDESILREITSVVDVIVQLAKTAQGRRVTEIYYNAA